MHQILISPLPIYVTVTEKFAVEAESGAEVQLVVGAE